MKVIILRLKEESERVKKKQQNTWEKKRKILGVKEEQNIPRHPKEKSKCFVLPSFPRHFFIIIGSVPKRMYYQ